MDYRADANPMVKYGGDIQQVFELQTHYAKLLGSQARMAEPPNAGATRGRGWLRAIGRCVVDRTRAEARGRLCNANGGGQSVKLLFGSNLPCLPS